MKVLYQDLSLCSLHDTTSTTSTYKLVLQVTAVPGWSRFPVSTFPWQMKHLPRLAYNLSFKTATSCMKTKSGLNPTSS